MTTTSCIEQPETRIGTIRWGVSLEEFAATYPAHRWVSRSGEYGVAENCPSCPQHRQKDVDPEGATMGGAK